MSQETALSAVERSTLRKIGWRIVPFLVLCYFIAYVDRVNIGFAALTMSSDIGLTSTLFGFGTSLFFVAYVLFEMPSNVAMERFGARRWIARIMISWGIVGFLSAFAVGPVSFSVSRFLLGAAEAGFFPGVILYLTQWVPKAYLARLVAIFMVAIPLSSFFGSPLSAMLMKLDGTWGFKGWQWLLMLEALPAVALGVLAWFMLPSTPNEAKWLRPEERQWLQACLAAEHEEKLRAAPADDGQGRSKILAALTNRHVWILAMIYTGSSATSNTLSLWMPQILKSFDMSTTEAGLLNMIPFGVAAAFMIVWGIRTDKSAERLWNTAIPLALVAVSIAATLLTGSLVLTLILLTFALMGNYAVKGPFWSLTSESLSAPVLAAGIAAINTLGHLGTGVMSFLIGYLKETTGSFPVALTPLCLLTVIGCFLVFVIGRQSARTVVRQPTVR
ncbi:MFS transporter [Pseudomonas entomophila]|uniref:MFS transporter n=1 Tax=Pseudomonas entomophila TaxID=312306 RepID=UPI0023D7F6E7|nr:MFS transporter [Pseudomonas entomophila]MDF0733049.1 MFS transporter [Pseudomonas entomophila]